MTQSALHQLPTPTTSGHQQHVFTRQQHTKPPRSSALAAGAGGQTSTTTMQATKPAAITESSSLQLTRNLLRIAVYNIAYLRGLFPGENFEELRTLGMPLKKLKPICENSKRLVSWLENGVYDALSKKYLRTMVFAITKSDDATQLLESYEFAFRYSAEDGEVAMALSDLSNSRRSTKSQSKMHKDMTQEEVKKLACKMIRVLCELMKTFDSVPEERYLTIRLTYNDDTPEDYEPPYFRSCTNEAKPTYQAEPFALTVGGVRTHTHSLSLKVITSLESCSNEGEEQEADDVMSVHSGSQAQSSDHCDRDSEMSKDDGNDCDYEDSKEVNCHQNDHKRSDDAPSLEPVHSTIKSAVAHSKPTHPLFEGAAANSKAVHSTRESAAAISKPVHSANESAARNTTRAHSANQSTAAHSEPVHSKKQDHHQDTSAVACSMEGTYTQALNALSTEFQGPDPEELDTRTEDSDLTMVPDTYDEEKAAAVDGPGAEESEAYVTLRSWLYHHNMVGDNLDLVTAAAEFPSISITAIDSVFQRFVREGRLQQLERDLFQLCANPLMVIPDRVATEPEKDDEAPESASQRPQEELPANQTADAHLFAECLRLASSCPFIQAEKIAKGLKVSTGSAALLIQQMEKEGYCRVVAKPGLRRTRRADQISNYQVDSAAIDKRLKQDHALQMLEKCALKEVATGTTVPAAPKSEPVVHCSQETCRSGSRMEGKRRKASIAADPIYQNDAKIQRSFC